MKWGLVKKLAARSGRAPECSYKIARRTTAYLPDTTSPWYVSAQVLRGRRNWTDLFECPFYLAGDMSFNWNQVFETALFFVTEEFLRVDEGCVSIGD